MDSNGYNDSLFDTVDGQCYLTKRFTQTVRHEVFQGDPNRKFSKQEGLWINVSPEAHEKWHNGDMEELKARTQQKAEILWLMADWYRSIADFVHLFGRNYL